ncbi:MAG: methyltransferase domain-containing protein [Acidobacteriota bacterium]|nr:methyltransferase domain-containing protein [Acidobacteriota bacterium]
MSDWDAARYHQVSDPQRAWGRRVLDRLSPATGERIVDIGCGTGRLTADLHPRVGASGRIIAADRSWTMVTEARRHLPAGVAVVQADGTALPFRTASVDAVFSTATFHWISDHATLFAEIHRILRSGGRLVAQAGGGRNLERLYSRTAALSSEPEFAGCFTGWQDPWTFAGVDETRDRLTRAGFIDPDVSLESTPTGFPGAEQYAEFVKPVCLRHHLDRLPESKRGAFVDRLSRMAAADDPSFTLDYWRLNIDARKP